MSFDELEQQAREKLSSGVYGSIAGGAGADETMRANREAFRRWGQRRSFWDGLMFTGLRSQGQPV